MKYKIEKRGAHWYVLRKWWIPSLFSPRSLFMYGTGPFDERPLGFLSKEIAEAAVRKYPEGSLIIDCPGLPADPLVTREGQEALLRAPA